MKYFFIENWNKLFGIKNQYKLVAYISKLGQETIMENSIVSEYSERLAYDNYHKKLREKHGNKCGIDIRVIKSI